VSAVVKKRLILGAGVLATVGAVSTLTAGVTFGLFSASATPQANTFTTGTVTLSQDASGACAVTNAVPGDSGTCTLSVTYTGSASAFIGLDTATSGSLAATGGIVFAIHDQVGTTYPSSTTNLYVGTETGTTVNTFTVDWTLPATADNTFESTSATLTLAVHAVQSANNGSTSACSVGVVCPTIKSWS